MNFSRLFKVEPWNRWTLLQVRFYLLPFQPWTQHALSWCPQGTCYNPVCIPCPVLGTGLANKGNSTASHSFTHMFFDEMIIYSFRNTVYCSTSDSEFLGCVCAQLHPTLCDIMNCSPPGFPVHGISQAPILKWVAISSSGDLPDPGLKPMSPALAGRFLTTKLPGKPQSFLPLLKSYWGRYNQVPETVWQDEAESLEMV